MQRGKKKQNFPEKAKRKKMLRSLRPHSTANISVSSALILSPLFSFLFILNIDGGGGATAHVFIYAGCSQEKYQPNTAFEGSLNSLLASIVNSAPQASYNSFAVGNDSSSDAAVYGLYQCRGDLKMADCSRCIQSAVSQISLVCPYSYGAGLQLEGCYVRYEHVDFLGRLDTAVMFKKCSKSVSNDVEFYRRRDDVLADLLSGGGGGSGFRVSSSGLVEGFAQCLGDLSSGDCAACLAEAVGKLKNLCGSASASDVYLSKCYARYWASGYYDYSSDSSNNEDQIGKTVAIIVGVLAALAILVVILSVLRRA